MATRAAMNRLIRAAEFYCALGEAKQEMLFLPELYAEVSLAPTFL